MPEFFTYPARFFLRHPAAKDYADGILVVLPLIPGSIPFGMIIGAVAAKAHFGAALGISQSFIAFAGASQLAAIQLITEGATPAIIVLTALIINLRFAIYSASLAPHYAALPAGLRAVIGYLLTDPSFALCMARYAASPMTAEAKARYYLGGAIIMWAGWIAATAAGFFLGASIPPSWSLNVVAPLSFLVMVIPSIRDSAVAVAAVTGASIAIVLNTLPFNLGLFIAIIGGIAAGYFWERRGFLKGKPQSEEGA